MAYWAHRILKDGSTVRANQLPQNPYRAPSPEAGDEIVVTCGGQQIEAKVTQLQLADPNSNNQEDRIQAEQL